MPYELRGKCVYKTTGELVKCHETKEKAEAHRRALYANVPDARKASEFPYNHFHPQLLEDD